MNTFNFMYINFSKFILYRKPSIWTLSMAASKFEDRLDTSHSNIESYFSKTNTSLNTSAASTSSVSHDIGQSSDSKNKVLKSAKPDIVSYFKKNLDAKVKSFKEFEIDKNISEDNEELDSFLSVCNDINNVDSYADESCDSNTGKASTVIENTERVFCDKQNESIGILEVKEQSICNDVDFVDINEKSCNSKTESEIALLDSQDKPSGFFANLKQQCKLSFDVGIKPSCDSSNKKCIDTETGEASCTSDTKTVVSDNKHEPIGFFAKISKAQSNLNFDVRFEINSDSSDNKLNDSEASEESHVCDSKTIISNNQNKPLGFFAKKLKERSETNFSVRSESNFSIESETSCDSLKNEPMKNNQAEHLQNCNSVATSSISMHQQSSCSVSNSGSECVNLAPELTKLCEQCNKRIPIWEETEHLDYHLALNLSKEFSNNPRTVLHTTGNNSSSATGKNVSQKSKSGRKRGSATKSSSQSKKPLVKTKTIDSFFKS